jgi:transcriptional regulator with XRE-family HTH domain
MLAPGTMRSAGDVLRDWRKRRGLTQLDLACDAGISARHLSFVETGRAHPSRDVILRLAEQLDLPLRDRNALLVAAGFAPRFPQRPLSDPALAVVRRAVDALLAAHEPHPAIAIDRHWTLLAANQSVMRLWNAWVAPELLRPPVNVLRLTLHPRGLAPRIANYAEWRQHALAKLRRQIDLSGDGVLHDLLHELQAYPAPAGVTAPPPSDRDHGSGDHAGSGARIVLPFELTTDRGILSFLSTTTIFGTPVEVTLSELSIEAFHPADAASADVLRLLATTDDGNRPGAAGGLPPR